LSKAKEWGYRRSILSNYGIPFENVCRQLNKFKRDFKMMLVEPKVFKGILKLSEKILKLKLIF
jgi:cobalamin biosynthesis Co2+ chelatase CbiK